MIQSRNLPEWIRLDRRGLNEIMQDLGIIYKELYVKLFLALVDIARQTGQMEFERDLIERLVQRFLESEGHLLSIGETIDGALATFFELLVSKRFGSYDGKLYRFPVRYSHKSLLMEEFYQTLHHEIREMLAQISIKEGIFPSFPSLQQRRFQEFDFEGPLFKQMDAKDFNSHTIRRFEKEAAGKVVRIQVENDEVLVPTEDLYYLYKICNAIVKAYVEGIAGDELQWVVKKTQKELKVSPEKLHSALKDGKEDKTFYWLAVCTIARNSIENRKHFSEKKQVPVRIATVLMTSYLLHQRNEELKREIWSKQIEKFVKLIKEKDEGKEDFKLLDRGRLIKWMKEAYIAQSYEGAEQEEFYRDAIDQALQRIENGKWLPRLNRIVMGEREHFILRSRILPSFKKELVYLIESGEVFRHLKRVLKEKILNGEISGKRRLSYSRLKSYGRLVQREMTRYLLKHDYVFYVLYQNSKLVHSAIHDTSSQPFKDLKLYFLNESSMILLPYLELFGYDLSRLLKAARRSISLLEWFRFWLRRLKRRKKIQRFEEKREFDEEELVSQKPRQKIARSTKSTLVGTEKYKQPKNINQASEELKKALGQLRKK